MKNKNKTISRHCGHGPRVQGFYKEKTTLLNRLDPGYPAGRPSGMTTRKAFTLIELLVVVLIIGILAAVAVPQYQTAVDKSKFSAVWIAVRNLKQAQELYYLHNGTYATKAKDLEGEFGPTCTISASNEHIVHCEQFNLYVQPSEVHGDLVRAKAGIGNALLIFLDNSSLSGTIRCFAYHVDGDRGKRLCASLGGKNPDSGDQATVYSL